MTDLDRKLGALRQCRQAIEWLRDARRETVTSLWFFRDHFADPQEATRDWKQILDLMDNTFSVLLRGNQLTTDILRGLTEAEGDDTTFRGVLTEKVERLEATGNRAVRGVRRFAEAVDPNFFNTNARRARPPAFLTDGSDPESLPKVFGHLQDLEALIAEEEHQLVDLDSFLSLRARDLEMGLQW